MESNSSLRPAKIRKRGSIRTLVCLAAAGLSAIALACTGAEETTPLVPDSPTPDAVTVSNARTVSPAYQAGKELFGANCAQCHGATATGTDFGPPLVHRLYVPSHHPDFSFQAAVTNGVITHHWFFGDMPPVPGLSEADVDNIICYVRKLQRDGGLPVEVSC